MKFPGLEPIGNIKVVYGLLSMLKVEAKSVNTLKNIKIIANFYNQISQSKLYDKTGHTLFNSYKF